MSQNTNTLNTVTGRQAHRGLGIAGFVLSFLAVLSPVGLALSIVSLLQARKAGERNGFALAGTIIGAVGTIVLVVVAIYAIVTLANSTEICGITDLVAGTCR